MKDVIGLWFLTFLAAGFIIFLSFSTGPHLDFAHRHKVFQK